MAIVNIWAVLAREKFVDFQTVLFRTSMLTGWVLLGALMLGFAIDVPTGMED